MSLHPVRSRCRESALIPANGLLSLSFPPYLSVSRSCLLARSRSLARQSTMRRHHGGNYVGAQREGTWCKTRSKYVPGSPPLDLEDLLARFLRVPAIHADEKSANLERLYVSCVPSPGREMANFLRRERERHPSPPPPVSLDAVETVRGTTATLKFIHLPLSFTRKISSKIL